MYLLNRSGHGDEPKVAGSENKQRHTSFRASSRQASYFEPDAIVTKQSPFNWAQLNNDEDTGSHSLRTVSLTNRRLRNLARCFVFANFHFRPYSFRWVNTADGIFPCATVFLPAYDELALHTERLASWTLPTIAPLVRTIHISHWRRNASDRPHVDDICRFEGGAGVHRLLLQLFERLDVFTGLRLLSGYYALFTETASKNLVQISHSSPQFLITANWSFQGDMKLNCVRSLETLHKPRTHPSFDRSVDEPHAADIPSMPNVHELSVMLPIFRFDTYVALVATKFPNVRKFRLETHEEPWLAGEPRSAPPFADLESYTGPVECLSFFLPSSGLKELSIYDPDVPAPLLAAAIERFNLLPTITAFTCSTTSRGLDISTLRQLLAPFPALEKLEMRVRVRYDSEDNWVAWTEAFHLYANLAADEPALVFPSGLSEIQLLLTRTAAPTRDAAAHNLCRGRARVESEHAAPLSWVEKDADRIADVPRGLGRRRLTVVEQKGRRNQPTSITRDDRETLLEVGYQHINGGKRDAAFAYVDSWILLARVLGGLLWLWVSEETSDLPLESIELTGAEILSSTHHEQVCIRTVCMNRRAVRDKGKRREQLDDKDLTPDSIELTCWPTAAYTWIRGTGMTQRERKRIIREAGLSLLACTEAPGPKFEQQGRGIRSRESGLTEVEVAQSKELIMRLKVTRGWRELKRQNKKVADVSRTRSPLSSLPSTTPKQRSSKRARTPSTGAVGTHPASDCGSAHYASRTRPARRQYCLEWNATCQWLLEAMGSEATTATSEQRDVEEGATVIPGSCMCVASAADSRSLPIPFAGWAQYTLNSNVAGARAGYIAFRNVSSSPRLYAPMPVVHVPANAATRNPLGSLSDLRGDLKTMAIFHPATARAGLRSLSSLWGRLSRNDRLFIHTSRSSTGESSGPQIVFAFRTTGKSTSPRSLRPSFARLATTSRRLQQLPTYTGIAIACIEKREDLLNEAMEGSMGSVLFLHSAFVDHTGQRGAESPRADSCIKLAGEEVGVNTRTTAPGCRPVERGCPREKAAQPKRRRLTQETGSPVCTILE
ncbi:hypothetical protein C8F01DRAFT_1351934 [Mycena amicta]|nr:hypothetical protein C8F01DRAFT_1351934 [Mycena amicta]